MSVYPRRRSVPLPPTDVASTDHMGHCVSKVKARDRSSQRKSCTTRSRSLPSIPETTLPNPMRLDCASYDNSSEYRFSKGSFPRRGFSPFKSLLHIQQVKGLEHRAISVLADEHPKQSIHLHPEQTKENAQSVSRSETTNPLDDFHLLPGEQSSKSFQRETHASQNSVDLRLNELQMQVDGLKVMHDKFLIHYRHEQRQRDMKSQALQELSETLERDVCRLNRVLSEVISRR